MYIEVKVSVRAFLLKVAPDLQPYLLLSRPPVHASGVVETPYGVFNPGGVAGWWWEQRRTCPASGVTGCVQSCQGAMDSRGDVEVL